MPARPLTLLVTGFGPFPGAPSNPSSAILNALEGAFARRLERLGVRLVLARLPVVFAQTPGALSAVLRDAAPDAVLHVGLAGRRRKLGVERQARNRLTSLSRDAARALPASRLILAAGPEFRRARLPVAQVARALNLAGAPAETSRDAGSYVCNQTLYLTLGADIPLAGFIHVPRPRGRLPMARRTKQRISLQQMSRAIEAVLVMMAREARRAQ
jgi:pyroglutamyl-peptidase